MHVFFSIITNYFVDFIALEWLPVTYCLKNDVEKEMIMFYI